MCVTCHNQPARIHTLTHIHNARVRFLCRNTLPCMCHARQHADSLRETEGETCIGRKHMSWRHTQQEQFMSSQRRQPSQLGVNNPLVINFPISSIVQSKSSPSQAKEDNEPHGRMTQSPLSVSLPLGTQYARLSKRKRVDKTEAILPSNGSISQLLSETRGRR